MLPHTTKVGFTATKCSYVFIGCYRMSGRQIGYENLASDNEGPRLGRASTGAPPLSALLRLDKEPASPPEMPKEEAQGGEIAGCVLWLLLPRRSRHVCFCVFPTGSAVLMESRLTSLSTCKAVNTNSLQGSHLPSALLTSGCCSHLSCPSWWLSSQHYPD